MQIELTTRSFLVSCFRQKRKIAVLFLLIVLAGATYISVTKPIYEVKGSFLVKFGNNMPEKIMHFENGSMSVSRDDRRETIKSDIDILTSQNLLTDLINETGADNLYPGITQKVASTNLPSEAVMEKLIKGGDLNIKSDDSSNVISITLKNPNPQVAAHFVHRLMEVFIAKQSAIYNKPQTDFLRDQVKEAATKLEESQKKLEDFKSKTGVTSLDQELAQLLREKGDTSALSLDNTDSAWDKLAEVQAEEKHLLQTYRPDSPQVAQAHQAVLLAQQQLRDRQAALRARTSSQTAKINNRIMLLEKQRKEYDDLARQVQLDEANYKHYQLDNEEERVNATLNEHNITSVVVVDEPIVPLKPAYPHRLMILIFSFIAGIVVSLSIALAFEAYDQRFTEPAQLAYVLGVPVIASFSRGKGV